MVLEAYKDSVGVWTWAGGVTNASGHNVERYIDKPQTLDQCLKITIWLMRERYLEPVFKAFKGVPLQEHQLAAALSFHWNTGAIERAQWVKDFNAGKTDKARDGFMQWTSRGLLTERRKREQRLFMDGRWPGTLKVPVFPVTPAHKPAIGSGRLVDLSKEVATILATR
jgi:lysozyme